MPLLNTSWSQGEQVGNEWIDTHDAWESSENIPTVTPRCGLIVLVNPVENSSIVTSVDQWLLWRGLTSWEELRIFTHLNLVTGTCCVCYIIKWMSLRSRFWADGKADNLIIEWLPLKPGLTCWNLGGVDFFFFNLWLEYLTNRNKENRFSKCVIAAQNESLVLFTSSSTATVS